MPFLHTFTSSFLNKYIHPLVSLCPALYIKWSSLKTVVLRHQPMGDSNRQPFAKTFCTCRFLMLLSQTHTLYHYISAGLSEKLKRGNEFTFVGKFFTCFACFFPPKSGLFANTSSASIPQAHPPTCFYRIINRLHYRDLHRQTNKKINNASIHLLCS